MTGSALQHLNFQDYINALRKGDFLTFLNCIEFLRVKYQSSFAKKEDFDTSELQKLLLHELSNTDLTAEDIQKINFLPGLFNYYPENFLSLIGAETNGNKFFDLSTFLIVSPNVIAAKKLSATYYLRALDENPSDLSNLNSLLSDKAQDIEASPQFKDQIKNVLTETGNEDLKSDFESENFIPLFLAILNKIYSTKKIQEIDFKNLYFELSDPLRKSFLDYQIKHAYQIQQQQLALYEKDILKTASVIRKALPLDVKIYSEKSDQSNKLRFRPIANLNLNQNSSTHISINPTKADQLAHKQAKNGIKANISLHLLEVIKFSIENNTRNGVWVIKPSLLNTFRGKKISIDNSEYKVPTHIAEIYNLTTLALSINKSKATEIIKAYKEIARIGREASYSFAFFRKPETQAFYDSFAHGENEKQAIKPKMKTN